MTLKLFPLIQYSIRHIFVEKSCKKYAPKASPRSLLILVNNPYSRCMQEILLEIRYFERGLLKSL